MDFLLTTPRLILRRYRESDLQALCEILGDPITVEFEPYRAMDDKQVLAVLCQRIKDPSMIAVALRENDGVIGNLYFDRQGDQAELGYVFNRNHWKKGYAREACQALIQWGFAQGIKEINASCDPANPNSWRLLEALGFIRMRHLIANVSFFNDAQGRPILKDTYEYRLIRKD